MLPRETVHPVMGVEPAATFVKEPGLMLAASKLPLVIRLAWAGMVVISAIAIGIINVLAESCISVSPRPGIIHQKVFL
jgi:hypothetical protein